MDLIRLQGMREFRSELRALDKRFGQGIRRANKRAAELVAGRARALLLAGPGQAPATASTVKALAGQAYASVRMGGNPTAMGDNFGSIYYTQFRPWKHKGEGDYGLYKAIGETRSDVVDQYGDFVDDALKQVFPD